jgi:hypothetical protein
MSTSAPWNFQPATKDTGNVKLFNPQENTSLQNGQIPSTDGDLNKLTLIVGLLLYPRV